jgi:hypothetical protein
MAETHNTQPIPQPNAPFKVRKMPLDPNYTFVPQPGARVSPIPTRFEGQVPIIVPGVSGTTR